MAKNEDNPFREFLTRYVNDPVGFVTEVRKVTPDDWQKEFLNAIVQGERRISVRSSHGVGKSTAASWAILWHILFRFPQKTLVTAPTSGQLFDALFAELKTWITELPSILSELLEVKSDRVTLKSAPSESFISCRTSRAENPEALQGAHSKFVLLVADEASGVAEQVFEAAAGSMSGESAVTVLLGNPTRTSGLFFDSHNRSKDQWWTRKVSAHDSPRVSESFIEEMEARYGPESNAFRIRVLGEFPRSDDDTVIALDLVESAQNRDIEVSADSPIIWGVDVSRFGQDLSVLCRRQGRKVEALKTWRQLDLMQLTGAIVAEYESQLPRTQPSQICVDSIGVGGGVVDRLIELGLPAIGINTAESPSTKGTYLNLRAELWWQIKAWLELRDCQMPKDDLLLAELVSPKYKFTSSGKLQLESKDDMRKRGLASPDRADALALTFAVDAITMQRGRTSTMNWNTPLKRGLSVV